MSPRLNQYTQRLGQVNLSQYSQIRTFTFLDTSFDFNSNSMINKFEQVKFDNTYLRCFPHSIKIDTNEIVSKFDLSFNIEHNLINNQLSCTINASLDLFNKKTINNFAQRFYFLLENIFLTFDYIKQLIYQLSFINPGRFDDGNPC